MIIGMVKGRSFSILGLERDYITTGSVGLKIGFVFDDEWNGLAKTVVFQNGTIIKTAAVQNGECTVPFEVLVNPGAKLRIGIRGVNGVDVVIPTIYTEATIYQGTGDTVSPGGSYTPSEIEQIQGEIGDLSELETTEKSSLVGAINELALGGGGGLTTAIKDALLQLAEKVAYIDNQGQDYYQDLYDALYPPIGLVSISAVFEQGQTVVYDTDSLDSLKPMLVVTAAYEDSSTQTVPSTDYTLSGRLTEGTSTITVSYGGKIDTFTVTVTSGSQTIIVAWSGSGADNSSSIIDARNADVYWELPYISGSSYYASDATSESDFVRLHARLYSDAERTNLAGYWHIDTQTIETTARTTLNRPSMPVDTLIKVAPAGYYVVLVASKREGFSSNASCRSFLNANATDVKLVAVGGA